MHIITAKQAVYYDIPLVPIVPLLKTFYENKKRLREKGMTRQQLLACPFSREAIESRAIVLALAQNELQARKRVIAETRKPRSKRHREEVLPAVCSVSAVSMPCSRTFALWIFASSSAFILVRSIW